MSRRALCWHPVLGDYDPNRLHIEAHVEVLLDNARREATRYQGDTAQGAPDDWPTISPPDQETD